jgi:plastocyanin
VTRVIPLVAALATLVLPPAAAAQAPVVQAVDDLTGGNNNRWQPSAVTVQVGDTVTWRYDGSILAHNVKSTTPNWNVDTATSTQDNRPVSHTFTAEGVYDFVCKFHADTMTGSVTVGSPPPPPPPPPSEQHWVNDGLPPTVFERADGTRPRLTRVRVAAVRNGARVRFRLSERAHVVVRLERRGRALATVRKTYRAGSGRLTIRDRRVHGRYRVELVARDYAGNRSRVKRGWVTIH